METMTTTVDGVDGEQVSEVELAIDYTIIEHFSKNLYSSPNKAVEELVANSFDALATVAYVYVPGSKVAERVVVWDDGQSMSVDDLKALWVIASSPKNDGTDRIATNDEVEARKVIGKFGIGKLASYQLGNRISHLCKADGRYLLVTIDFRDILPDGVEASPDGDLGADGAQAFENGSGDEQRPAPVGEGDRDPDLKRESFKAPIVELSEKDAKTWAKAQFKGRSEAFDRLWPKSAWTLAVVDELKEHKVPPGRLKWELGRSMPLRPDFAIKVNDQDVVSKFLEGSHTAWDMGAPEVAASLASAWADAKKEGDVTGDLEFGQTEDGTPFARFPELGDVRADIGLFTESLKNTKANDHGRSYGFFVMVRERLLNPQDGQLTLAPQSFGTFYKSQIVLHVDGLDADLLADRERLNQSSPRIEELKVLQEATYRAARQKIEAMEADEANDQSTEALLPIASREHYRGPLGALLLNEDHTDRTFSLNNPVITRNDLPENAPASDLDVSKSALRVNTNHPFYSEVRNRLGGGKKAREAARALDLMAISGLLLEGHLLDAGLEAPRVNAILDWQDGLLRDFARQYRAAPEHVLSNLADTSYQGGKAFEDAIAEIFELMGFKAHRDGSSGKKDVLVFAPLGLEEFTFTVEAKGSGDKIELDSTEIAGAASHRDAAGGEHAIIVAREFAGLVRDPKKDDAEVLKQCRAVKGVSILTVENLAALYEAQMTFFYTLTALKPILSEIEPPSVKAERIEALEAPMEDFDFAAVLHAIWEEQQGDAAGDVVPYRSIWQKSWKGKIDFDDFQTKMEALETLADGRMRTSGQDVRLLLSPELIAAFVADSLGV